MRKAKKVLTLVLCACLLVSISIGVTIAYLTDTASVTNSFTVGKINKPDDPPEGPKYAGYLDEAKVDVDGKLVEGADRVTSNTYKLVPGSTYTKDPTVHIGKDSEKCYVFVKITNGISAYINDLVIADGWTELEDNVYYQVVETNKIGNTDLVVFSSFTVKDEVTAEQLKDITAESKIIVDAYIIQYAGFEPEGDTDEAIVEAAANAYDEFSSK